MSQMSEFVKLAIKYLLEGFVVAIVALLVPRKALQVEEIVVIALTAAAAFAILDIFIPSMGSSMRQGAGLGLGFNLVKFPM
jgi:ABC-type Co2+ transport system permease subunit